MTNEINNGENGVGTELNTLEAKTDLSYEGYRHLGGLINEADYTSALARARAGGVTITNMTRNHIESIARFVGVSLGGGSTGIDPRVLYGILREDEAPAGVVHHHDTMSDQQIALETFRMLEAGEAALLIQNAYPNIFGQP